MRKLKTLLSLLLSLCLVLSFFPAASADGSIEAADPAPGEEQGILVPASEGTADPAALPRQPAADEIQASSGTCGENLTWTLDDDDALTISGTGEMDSWEWEQVPWRDCSDSILSVIVEDGVTGIGDFAFADCYRMKSVELPSSVSAIGNWAFAGCSSLIGIAIPDKVRSIGDLAFQGCNCLTSMTIPAGVVSIGYGAFSGCGSIKEFRVDVANTAFRSEDGVLFSKDGTELIRYPNGKMGAYQIPEGVSRICEYAFEYCGNLSAVTLPASLREIAAYAFYFCSGLSTITLPEGLLSMYRGAFEGTKLCEVTFPASLQNIYDEENDFVYDVHGGAVFDDAPVENIYVSPDNPYFCSVDGIVFSKDKSKLVMFPPARKGSYTVPEGVTSLGIRAFDSVSLEHIVLPESLNTIGACQFTFASKLEALRIPTGVKQVDRFAFPWSGLQEIRFDGSAPEGIENGFCLLSTTVFYPADDPSWDTALRQRCEQNNMGRTLTWQPYVYGDINSDGQTDLLDLVRLRKHLAGEAAELIRICADLNGDCTLDAADLLRLRRILVGLS